MANTAVEQVLPSSTDAVSSDKLLIHLWCGPRTLSTASIYSWSRRPDTHVLDEPLYAHWLHQNPSTFRPYREQLLRTSNVDGNAVLDGMDAVSDKRVVVAKHMTKFIVGCDKARYVTGRTGARTVKHVFLFRDPMKMIVSWGEKNAVHQEGCTLDATSFPHMVQLYSELRSAGLNPVAVDSELLAAHPEAVLTELCRRLEVPFHNAMLSWPAGPKPDIDGLWGPYWYQNVWQTTGFGQSAPSSPTILGLLGFSGSGSRSSSGSGKGADGDTPRYPRLSADQLAVYREALPFYDLLRRHAIGADPLNPGSSIPQLHLPGASGAGGNNAGTGATGAIGAAGGAAASTGADGRLQDPRNADVLVFVGDRLLPREMAKVSVLDSAVQGGDAVWEGLRVYGGERARGERAGGERAGDVSQAGQWGAKRSTVPAKRAT